MNYVLRTATAKWGSFKTTGRSDEVIFCCPNCGKRKLYVNLVSGVFHCFRCLDVRGIIRRKGHLDGFSFGELLPTQTGSLVTDWSPFEDGSIYCDICLKYLVIDRCIPRTRVEQFKIGVSKKFFAVSIPFSKFFILRFLYDAKPKYLYPSRFPKKLAIFNLERAYDKRTVYVFEGVFDVICAKPYSSVAVFGKGLSDQQVEMLGKLNSERLVLAFDSDVDVDETIEAAARLAFRFPGEVCLAKLPTGKDPADLGENNFDREVRIEPVGGLCYESFF